LEPNLRKQIARVFVLISLCNLILPLVGVFNLAPTSKLVVHVPGSRRCVRWTQNLYWFGQKVPTFSHRRLALPAPLMIKARSRGYKRAREGGEAPKSLIRGGGSYKVES
jgi:hypothetical protein